MPAPASASTRLDAVVVGSGPNGLAAAVTLAGAGRSVKVYEAADTPGGAVRSGQSILQGYVHDLGAAVFPMAVDTPFFRGVPMREFGLEFIFPEASVAHPLDDGTAAVLWRDPERTAAGLGPDSNRYWALMRPVLGRWDELVDDLFAPLHLPRHPAALVSFGLRACVPAAVLARAVFRTGRARALLAGLAAHSILPLWHPMSAAFAVIMAASGHLPGWPVVRGGAGRLSAALVSYLLSLGGEIETGREVRDLRDVEPSRAVFFDTAPARALRIAGATLPPSYGRRLQAFRHGPGAFKVDWALSGPIPWKAPACREAATVHLGGTLEEIERAEAAVWRGVPPEKPFVFLVQPSLFDASRAPAGRHTAWAYCHVPNGSAADMTGPVEAQVERFAPGFKDLVLARCTMGPADLELFDMNCTGGDIAGGANTFTQVLGRPVFSANPYAMPAPGLYLCSASTPPGGGVHGLCGYHAARAFLEGG
ncbi:MAG TPA: NAD(P)/FAD-dependent oxidoreductase [Deltaproteobacteria bacterium]|nr:NAD(P)/FAD-dependent oxidoreductase [Deltaproteobacteria bacterium]HOM28774.1 NAD(P)/FAD-dependent oxidoreductase [Deltaproteobacteria bacterium]HPP80570.1 NAD(P)/FAD-dependent oxidoreductase [Deltaproteobacteria bacterium]